MKKCNIKIRNSSESQKYIPKKESKLKINQEILDSKRHLKILDIYYNTSYKCKYLCKKCGYIGITSEKYIKKGTGCAVCAGQKIEKNINSIYVTDKWMIPYIGEENSKKYSRSSNKVIDVKCIDCGKIKKICIRNLYKRKKISCICGDGISYPNKLMYSILIQLNLKFETEKSFDWCKYFFESKMKRGIYDFYFKYNNNEYVIEMDGMFHYKENKMTKYNLNDIKYIDDQKDMLAKNNNITVIRIDSKESDFIYIKKNILDSKLSQIFNLNIINWNKCEEFSVNNMVRSVCELKRDDPTLSTSEISTIIGLHESCIRKYLHKGNKIWDWVKYDPKSESKKVIYNNAKKCSKSVEIYKHNKLLGTFSSIHELSRNGEKLYNAKLSTSLISAVCRGVRNTHKGYIFKYSEIGE